ncbi:hypothetical protein HanOQP8_Chr08g0277761 [Helianthus annuus]|nr:hypothetical protein HanOQP8_Chr08g0277761 [Helianthus annuus]
MTIILPLNVSPVVNARMYPRLQIHGDSVHQMVLPCIVASYEHHINEVTFGTG